MSRIRIWILFLTISVQGELPSVQYLQRLDRPGAVRAAGLPITPVRAITVESLMSQVRKFGMVVQSGPELSE